MADQKLNGKVCIVTGTGSGLGRAMTLALTAAGAKVAGVDISEQAAAKTVADAEAGSVLPVIADITSVDDVERIVTTTTAELGGLHVLINCAGLGMSWLRTDYMTNRLNFWDLDPDGWQRVMDVNVRGAFLLSRAAAPYLMKQGWGRILNVTTSFNTMMRGGNMPYGQSKAALESATAAWADDLQDTGVSANVLIPGGAADTPMVPQESGYDRSELVRPDQMGPPVVWLASEASDGVNGKRIMARRWDPSLPDAEAAKAATAPAAWPDLAADAGVGQAKAK
jgi:3-oxoacyl-[acyl-carrier protein] reductase